RARRGLRHRRGREPERNRRDEKQDFRDSHDVSRSWVRETDAGPIRTKTGRNRPNDATAGADSGGARAGAFDSEDGADGTAARGPPQGLGPGRRSYASEGESAGKKWLTRTRRTRETAEDKGRRWPQRESDRRTAEDADERGYDRHRLDRRDPRTSAVLRGS